MSDISQRKRGGKEMRWQKDEKEMIRAGEGAPAPVSEVTKEGAVDQAKEKGIEEIDGIDRVTHQQLVVKTVPDGMQLHVLHQRIEPHAHSELTPRYG